MTERRILLTEQDYDRLCRLLEQQGGGKNSRECAELEDELDRAEVVPPDKMPANVVTMRSKVRFRDEASGEEQEATLVYPFEADVQSQRISVLAPIGAALLGLSVGESIDWPVPSGSHKRLRVVDVIYQPEAAGRPDL
ncbi:MAG TPA: nucleoside diphosphate kinase regulator [Terriglobales bacterium]|nr:nucleoside diphosphate kinase regulator [Terriglobales bacterium]